MEARNFDIRKNLLKYDDVMNDQRKVIFEQRIEMMNGDDLSEVVASMREDVVDGLVAETMPPKAYPEEWKLEELREGVRENLNLDLPVDEWALEEGIDDNDVRERILDRRRRSRRPRGPTNTARKSPPTSRNPFCCRRSIRSGASIWKISNTCGRSSASVATDSATRWRNTSRKVSNCSTRCSPISARPSRAS